MKVIKTIAAMLILMAFIGIFLTKRGQRNERLVTVFWVFFVAFVILSLQGCADLMPIDEGSRAAEVTWLSMDAIDTAQTYQFAKRPQCFHEADSIAAHIYGSDRPPPNRILLINGVLALAHPLVSRWFDEHADAAYDADDDSVGLWFVGRGLWHMISIGATGLSIANNYGRGISPFHAPTCQEQP